MDLWQHIANNISETLNTQFHINQHHAIAGGCINSAFQVRGNTSQAEQDFFVKTNRSTLVDMFEAEFTALEQINQSNTLRAPEPVCVGEQGTTAYLVMEYLELCGSQADSDSYVQLGRNLAAMHGQTQKQYGWTRDNTIGSTPQVNTYSDDWVEFYRHHRLGFQYQLASKNGFGGRLQQQGEKLMSHLPAFFDEQPAASLLHGDLWSGNYSVLDDGEPVIFDPASYYGDRETDLAMTELFGGFPAQFYAAYKEAYPLDSGYNQRKTLYNLYHILNHLNLFGGGYLGQAESMTDRLLSEVI